MRVCYHFQMLNTFPSLLSYSWYAPFILRVVLGIILIDVGSLKFRGERADWVKAFDAYKIRPAKFFVSLFALFEIVGGALLLIGLYTQTAALAFVVLSGIEFYTEYTEGNILRRDIVFYALVFAIALSLLLTGAGAYAKDLPL
ncbi:MAG: hypothetical protein JWN50_723 [Parcubacteria group bacterium]|nr:hypothetical protein [Parcubacteria group bacterium]